MSKIEVESIVEIRTPYLDKLSKNVSPYSLVHEGMVGIVSKVSILSHRVLQGNCAGPHRESRIRVETRVTVEWERSEAQGGGTWTAYYPLSALKIAK